MKIFFHHFFLQAINLSNHYGAEFVLLYRFPNNKNWSCGVKAIDPVVKTADGLSLKRANKFLERTSVQAVSKEWLAESTILQGELIDFCCDAPVIFKSFYKF